MPPTVSQILVPVDFSPQTDLTVEYAGELARRFGASLRLLHVVQPLTTVALGQDGIDVPTLMELEARVAANAERQMSTTRTALAASGITVSTEVLTGHPATVIVNVARARKCDLIVMGTHGRTGLPHLFMGSVAEKVTRLAPCPVLTVRALEWQKTPA